jgi:aspartyl-tRNA(Asn)/glutamyl-tRNA(Gln) amidotransferase subunit B
MGELSRTANEMNVEPSSLVTPTQVAELQSAVEAGTINDKLAREALAGLIANEGTVAEIIEKRGLTVVSDDGALIAAIDAALASQPDVLEKIASGKVEAAGAIIGAVMKAMGGKADAARVRELVIERASA